MNELEVPSIDSSEIFKQTLDGSLKERGRKVFDKVILQMYAGQEFVSTYVFYAHLISQCSLKFVDDEEMPFAAGVAFNLNHYELAINPDRYNDLPTCEQIGILKHEMLHILYNHVSRIEDRIPLPWNVAADMAINCQINRKHLPDWVVYPDLEKWNFPKDLKSEDYYELLKEQHEKQQQDNGECQSCNGSGEGEDGEECQSCGGSGKQKNGFGQGEWFPGKHLDDHSKWKKSKGDEELRKDITKNMIDKAISKSRGNLPANISDILELFSRDAKVSWKKVLRNLFSNKKANSRRTIMRQDRRFPTREDLKGKTKDRTFDVIAIADVSGSMSNAEELEGLNELHDICKSFNLELKLIQVDTEVHDIETFTKKTKLFNRKAAGGTYIYPAIEYILDKKIPYDAIIIITDGGTENVSKWPRIPKGRTIFLTTGESVPGIGATKFQQFNLRDK